MQVYVYGLYVIYELREEILIMAKIEYKDVPIYFAHADGSETDTSVVNTIIDDSVASGSIKSADDAVTANIKEWANARFQTK